MTLPAEVKDISTMSGGTFTVPALTSGAVSRPGVIATPVENALAGMARLHNALHGTDASKRADVSALRAVYRRGQRSYDKRRHPSSSRRQWGMRRVRRHLELLATGKRPHPRYVHDDDLLPHGHPLAASSKGERKALLIMEGRPDTLGYAEPIAFSTLAVALMERKSMLDQLDALEVKGMWDPDKHPRDAHGRFMHLGAMVAAMIDGKQAEGTVVGIRGQNVTVRTDDGAEHVVKAATAQVTDHAGPHMTIAEHAKAHTQADQRYRQLVRAGHPEAAAWQQRRDALGTALKGRADNLSTDEVRRGLAGEHVDGPLAPAKAQQLDQAGDAASAAPSGLPGDAPTRPDGQEWGSGYSPADPRNDPAYDKYVANLDAKLAKAMQEVGETDKLYDHVDGIDGAYQPDRKAAHDAILAELIDRYHSMPRERKAIMLAGPPGAGKSTTIKQLGHTFGVEADDKGNPTNYATVNPDDLKEMMIKHGLLPPEYAQYGLGDLETACLIHEESSHLSKRLMRQLLAHGTNVIVDGTFSGKLDKNVGKVQDLRSEGYDVAGVLVDGDVERSFTNAGSRHMKGPDGKPMAPDPTGASGPLAGRYVPYGHIEAQRPTGQFSDIMARPHRSQNAENFEAARPIFNGGVFVFDNSPGEDGKPNTKLVYHEEAEPGGTRRHEGLGDEHLEKLRNGTTGRRASTGDLPSMVANALTHAVADNRPKYIQAGYQGYGVADAPIGFNDYVHVTPQGHVTHVKRTMENAETTVEHRPIPKSDVEKIVDHYVRPRPGSDAGARA